MGRTVYSDDGRFEWDEEKNRKNIRKHRFAFSEILEVFDDPYFVEGYDEYHSDTEDRYYGIGCLNGVVLIVVYYTIRGERTRIISAQRAEQDDEETYYDNIKTINP